MQIRTILYQYIKTLIKHVFLLNFTYELLMVLEVFIDKLANWPSTLANEFGIDNTRNSRPQMIKKIVFVIVNLNLLFLLLQSVFNKKP